MQLNAIATIVALVAWTLISVFGTMMLTENREMVVYIEEHEPRTCIIGDFRFVEKKAVRGFNPNEPIQGTFVGEQLVCARDWQFGNIYGPSIEAYLDVGGKISPPDKINLDIFFTEPEDAP